MSDRPDWDDQFAETEDKRNERLRAKRQAAVTFYPTHRILEIRDLGRTYR